MSFRPCRQWVLPVMFLFVLLASTRQAGAMVDVGARVTATKSIDRDGYVPPIPDLRAGAETEPNDDPASATPIELGVAVEGMVSGIADEDWYALATTPGAWVTVSTSSSGASTTDTVLEAFGADGTTRLAMDDDSGMGLFSALEHLEVPGDGQVLVRVTRYSALGDDAYQLLAESGSAPPPAPANDLPQLAETLATCNTGLTGSTVGATSMVAAISCLEVDPVGGEVFYRVNLPFSFELTVLVEPTTAWDLSVYLFTDPEDPEGSCLDAADIAYAGEGEAVRFLNEVLPVEDREIYIAVDSWTGTAAGDFILSTRCDFVVSNEASSFGTLKSRFQGN